jgi:N-methylhydantoinase B
MSHAIPIDPITLEVVCEGLIAIVREMRASIIRSSYSPVIYELDDFSCALFNGAAEMVAQSDDHPGHVMPMPWSVRCAMEDFAGEIHPGDLILLNDAYRGGTHLNDVTLLAPVFEGERLTLIPAVRSHWADVGGASPGSYSGLSTNIYQEGLRMPPIKLYERGEPNRAVMRLIEANMRLPEHRRGDLNAMLGACRTAESRLRRLFAKYGTDTVLRAIAINLDRSEARMRERIRMLPAGTYVHEDYLEYYDDGRFDPVLMRLSLTVAGDKVIADFAGSNPQVPGVVNSSLAVAGAGVFVALKSTLDPDGAVNQGAFRPIELRAPAASIVDVRADAPAGAHGEVRKRAVSVMLGCLAQMAPARVSGDLCGTSFPNSMGGRNDATGRGYVYYEAPAGGNGGFREHDGSSAFVNVDFGNIRSIYNVEFVEAEMPIVVERNVLRTDSGGAGTTRGGLGLRRELRLTCDEASYSVLSDRAVVPPYGVLGGASAAPVRVSVRAREQDADLATPGKTTGLRIAKGAVVTMQSAGGGGYGDPLERDPRLVAADVIGGYVSPRSARDDYGVVIGSDGNADVPATALQREHLRGARLRFALVADESPAYEGIKGRHRVLRIAPTLAARHDLRANQLVELIGKHAAPLRAWIKLDESAPIDALPMDEFGRRVLGVAAGERVWLRELPTPIAPGERRA